MACFLKKPLSSPPASGPAMGKESTLTERLLRPALSCVFIPLTREDARQEGLRGRSVTGLRNHDSEPKYSGSQWLLQSSRFQLPKKPGHLLSSGCPSAIPREVSAPQLSRLSSPHTSTRRDPDSVRPGETLRATASTFTSPCNNRSPRPGPLHKISPELGARREGHPQRAVEKGTRAPLPP